MEDSFEEENTKEICQNTVKKYIEENSIPLGDRLESKLLNLLRKAEEETV